MSRGQIGLIFKLLSLPAPAIMPGMAVARALK